MTQVNGKELKAILQEALAKDKDFSREILHKGLQSFLEAERDEQIGVGKHVRGGERQATRKTGTKKEKCWETI